mgnify:CR=1 FL=1
MTAEYDLQNQVGRLELSSADAPAKLDLKASPHDGRSSNRGEFLARHQFPEQSPAAETADFEALGHDATAFEQGDTNWMTDGDIARYLYAFTCNPVPLNNA